MAHSDYDSRYHHRPRHDSYYQPPQRDTDAYSSKAMRNSGQSTSYPSSYRTSRPRYAASPPPAARSSAQQPHRYDPRPNRWPPSPSVEDEAAALAREHPSLSAVGEAAAESSGEAQSRGSVDQTPIIEEIAQPQSRNAPHDDERRFVLVSDPHAEDAPTSYGARDRRRKSFAERGNMPHIKTDMNEPPVFTERTSTPYAYTKPQKESLAPSSGEYFLSPEGITPSSASVPRSVPGQSRYEWDSLNQNARPSKPRNGGTVSSNERGTNARPSKPRHKGVDPDDELWSDSRPSKPKPERYDPYEGAPAPRTNKNDVFDDSDTDSDAGHLRAPERRSARYSFTKGTVQKEDLRTNVLDSQAKDKSDRRKRDSMPPSTSRESFGYGSSSSSGSSKHPTPPSESPRSSSSSVNGESRRARPPPVDTGYLKSSSRYPESRPTSRPSSPSYSRGPSPPRSPKLPPRRPVSPNISRPSSRSGTRPASPLPFSPTILGGFPRGPVIESDWNATYPPVNDRPRPTRYDRYDSMPVPTPRIDVQSPSPARPSKPGNPLPYPVDDRQADIPMPPEEQYQYDHSYKPVPIPSSPRQSYAEPYIPSSPRDPPSASRPSINSRHTADSQELPRSPRMRSDSLKSQSSYDGRREGKRERRPAASVSHDKLILPDCPTSGASTTNSDWYTLANCRNFDVCPSCYEGVFADTAFSGYFTQTHRYEARVCDFSDSWVRLAWVITLQERRQSLDLIYTLSAIHDRERECPGDREWSTEHFPWYGILDQKSGYHVANFAICPRDLRMIEALFPSVKGYFTPLPASNPYAIPSSFACSLRVKSSRFGDYASLLMEINAEAQIQNQRPNISRFVELARKNAFKNECTGGKALYNKLWHFIPQLPDFTVCQECFDEVVLPARTFPSTSSRYTPPSIPNMFSLTVQPVPDEDPALGSSCCLYSPNMRRVWADCVQEDDFNRLQRKARTRKAAEIRLTMDKKDIRAWAAGLERGSRAWERAMAQLEDKDAEWKRYE